MRAGVAMFSAGALLFLGPFVLWNARHGWVTFQRTGDNLGVSSWAWGDAFNWALDFAGSQIGLGSPVLMVLMILLLVLSWRPPDRRVRFLWCFSAAPLAGVLLISLTQRINPNWPLVFYPGASSSLRPGPGPPAGPRRPAEQARSMTQ